VVAAANEKPEMIRSLTKPADSLSVSTAGAPPVRLDLVDLRDHPDEQLLASIHDGLYMRSFPRAEEREDFASLRAGLWGDERDAPPVCHFVVARSAAGVVDGFAACEYYPRSRCGLLSYIAVEPATRGRGVGRALLRRVVAALQVDAGGDELAAVFAEIHDPSKAKARGDSIPPLKRVQIMASLGARRVPVAYVQPELAPGRERSRALMLIAFPTQEAEVESLPSAVVRSFLGELYETLGVARPDEDVDFARSLVGLREETVGLEPLVPVEQPLLDGVTDYGVAIHLAVEKPRRPGGSDNDVRSFEEDMLAYAYPEPAPFRTSTINVADAWARLAVEFPGEVTYLSEGRRMSLRSSGGPGGRTRRFLLRAARTDFERSGLAVLHLVLGPDPSTPESSLNEYDLIKLMKLWQAGEGLSLDGTDAAGERFVRFRAAGRGLTLLELVREVFAEEVEVESPRVGTVQILHPICRRGLCAEIADVRQRQGAASPSPPVVAVGGLVQGLLDCAEIDADELADVFKEVELEDELVRAVHKGTLLVVSAADRAFSVQSIQLSVGISPYLLVPHAVLLHNEWWLWDAVRRLDESPGPGRRKLRRQERARAEVARTISERLVPNVFNYAEERNLYEMGRRSRGLHKRQRSVEGRLAAITADIRARHERIRSGVARSLPLIALVFTWSDALSKYDHTLVFAVLVPTTLLTLVALAFIFWRD
jgi:GNAT superfamily N-acetyltransferase